MGWFQLQQCATQPMPGDGLMLVTKTNIITHGMPLGGIKKIPAIVCRDLHKYLMF